MIAIDSVSAAFHNSPLHIDRRIVSKVAHRAYNPFVIIFFEEQAFGKIHAHFVTDVNVKHENIEGFAVLQRTQQRSGRIKAKNLNISNSLNILYYIILSFILQQDSLIF